MEKVIFNKDGSWHGTFHSLPSDDYLDDTKWIVAEMPENEQFDPAYLYAPVDGVAVKGELAPVPDTTEFDADIAANAYKDLRKDAYPTIVDQLDDIYHNGVDAWKTTIKAVKDANPKP